MPCPSDEVISALLEGKLPAEEADRVHRHADGCDECRLVIAAAARQQGESTLTDVGRLQPQSTPQTEDDTSRPIAQVAAASVGRYQILKHLATGGMGAVYAAYDPELDRRVALKVLANSHGGRHAPKDLQVRLQREAQAMARLAHPNVVAVHDVGTYQGRVFLAMEFVEGLTLRRWLKAQKRTWQELRDVFVQAGRGLAAAHAVGLVHRDFKPDNVLIGNDGRVRVADFGLARPGQPAPSGDGEKSEGSVSSASLRASLIDSPLTQVGVVMGTPRYMAPEQIRAEDPDARTDQFAFGVALYESLYTVRVFEAQNLEDRLKKIEAGEIQPPPAGHGVPEWLGRAARTAMRARPEDRFPSMDALLDAMTQDTRRRRLGAGVIAAATVVGVAAIAGGSWVLKPDLRCKGAERKLAGAWDEARRSAVKAAFAATGQGGEESFERTAKALDGYARGWTAMSEQVCRATRIRGEQPESVLALQVSCLELRLKELAKLTSLFETADAALAQKGVDAALGLSSVRGCGDVTALTELVPLPDDPAKRQEISGLRVQLAEANAIRLAGRYPAALEKAAEVVDRAAPLRYRPLEADALYLRGVVEDQLGRHEQAEASLMGAIAAGEAGRNDPAKVSAASRLVFADGQSSRYDEGRRWAVLAQASLERIGGNPEQEGELLNNLGTLYISEGRYQDAADSYERARRILVPALGHDHPKALNALTNVGNAYTRLGRLPEAADVLDDAIASIARVRGADHPTLISPLIVLTEVRTKRRLFAEAHQSIDRALEIARARFGPDHLRVAQCLEFKATAFQEEGRFDSSLAAYREALRIKQKALAPSDPELSFAYDGVGQSLLGLGRAREAVPVLETALSLRGPSPGDRADTRFGLAKALWAVRSDPKRALSLAEGAKDDYAKAARPDRVREVESWISAARR